MEWNRKINYVTCLQSTVSLLEIEEQNKLSYFLSATEAEVNEGIFNYLKHTNHQTTLISNNPSIPIIDEHYVYGFIRNITNAKEYTCNEYIDADKSNINNFKNNIRKYLLEDNCLEMNVNASHNNQLDDNYLNKFKNYIIDNLVNSINQQIEDESSSTLIEEELNEQSYYLNQKLNLFTGRQKDLKVIDNYINGDNENPLIIYGKSGLGKSALMAKAIDLAMDQNSYKIIFRFVGTTPQSGDTKSLWLSIMNELNIDIENSDNSSFEEFSLKIYQEIAKLKEHIVIFIDAVDQLYNEDTFMWLPEFLPSNIKIIITTLNDKHYEKDSFSFKILSDHHNNLYKLTPFEINNNLILEMLKEFDRTINTEQLNYVTKMFNHVKSPLYLKVAIKELIHWKDKHKVITDVSLNKTQKGIIKEYIGNLSQLYSHKNILIEKVMSYIYSSIDGLSEKELLGFLSNDKSFVDEIAPQKFHKNISNKLPIVIWARLQFEIETFITIKKIDGIGLMQFFHREFNDAIKEVFDTKKFHKELIEYTCSQILENNFPFEKSRLGKLYATLLINYAFMYSEESIMEIWFDKIKYTNKHWVVDFNNYLSNLTNSYYKGGKINEAKLIAYSIYNNRELFDLLTLKYNFMYTFGEIELAQANTKQAEVFFNKALEYASNDYDKALAEIQLAKTLRKSGNTTKSKELLESILKNSLIKDSIEKAEAQIQLGLCYFAFKEYEKALNYYKSADDYIITTNNRHLKLYNWLGISTVLASLDKVKEGLDLLIDIKNESQQYGFQNLYMDSLNGISKKYLLLEEYENALDYGLQALKLGIKQGHKILTFLMNGYILEAYAGLFMQNINDRNLILQNAQVHIQDIEHVQKNNIICEDVILNLVDESVNVWKKVTSFKD